MKPLHDINSAARLLSISPWTVRAYIRDRKLHPVRLGRRVLLEESELERFVSEARLDVSGPRVPQLPGEPQA
jgi:excisionase family DNA binding protein